MSISSKRERFMRAMVMPRFGGPDLFEERDVEGSEPGCASGRLDEMSLLLERGQIRPLVDEVLDLGRVGEAYECLKSGHGRGKVVLRVLEG